MDKVYILRNWGGFGIASFPGSFPLSSCRYEKEPGYEARFRTVLGIKPLDHVLAATALIV